MMTVYARKLSLNDCFFIFRSFPPHDFQLLNGPLNYSALSAPPASRISVSRKTNRQLFRVIYRLGMIRIWLWLFSDFAPCSRAIWVQVDGTFYVHAICRHVCMLCFVETWPISWLLFNVTSICFGLLEHHMLFVVSNFRPQLSAEFLFNPFFSDLIGEEATATATAAFIGRSSA